MNYFTLEEFRCKGGAAYPQRCIDDGTWDRNRATANVIRSTWGSSLTVLSGYRDPDYNAHLRESSILRLMDFGRTRAQAEAQTGVAKNSQHMYGSAADLQPTGEPHHAPQLADHVWMLYKSGKLPYLGGFGRYPTWIHYDVRPRGPGGSIATW